MDFGIPANRWITAIWQQTVIQCLFIFLFNSCPVIILFHVIFVAFQQTWIWKGLNPFFPLSIWADYSFLKTIIILRIYSIFWIYRREASGVVRQTLLQTRRKRQFLAKFLQQEEKLRRIKYGQHKKYGQSIKQKQNIFRLIWFRFILPL